MLDLPVPGIAGSLSAGQNAAMPSVHARAPFGSRLPAGRNTKDLVFKTHTGSSVLRCFGGPCPDRECAANISHLHPIDPRVVATGLMDTSLFATHSKY